MLLVCMYVCLGVWVYTAYAPKQVARETVRSHECDVNRRRT